MDENEFAGLLHGMVELTANGDEDQIEDLDGIEEVRGHRVRVNSFERAGLLTNNTGFVVTLADGSEFQVTVVQSRVGS